jgi:hypothetical protein
MVERYKLKYRGSGSVADTPEQLKKKNGHGGARFGNPNGKRGGNNGGAGKPLGLPNMKSREIKAKAAASGELPHEFLLRIMRTPAAAAQARTAPRLETATLREQGKLDPPWGRAMV